MPSYEWKGRDRHGNAQTGVLIGDNKDAVIAALRKQQIVVTTVKEKGKEIALPKFGGGISSKDIAVFTRQFSVMIDAGLPLVQHALSMALELVHDGDLSLVQLVQKVSHGPAELFSVRERGFLREGYWADLVLVDLHSPFRVVREEVLYKCGWSPLEGDTLRSRVTATLVNGELKYRDGEFFGGAGGMRLSFGR